MALGKSNCEISIVKEELNKKSSRQTCLLSHFKWLCKGGFLGIVGNLASIIIAAITTIAIQTDQLLREL